MTTIGKSYSRTSSAQAKLRWAAFGLAVLGLLDSLYLTWAKLTPGSVVCSDSGACDAVQNSPYAEIAGIPVALLGAGAYALLGLILAYEPRLKGEFPLLALFGLSLVGVLYSGYLTYLELAVIGAICPYCIASAVIITGIFVISVARLIIVED